jgi:hypothetical protein
MNKLYKNLVGFLGFRTTVTPSKRRGRPAGSGKRASPKLLKYVQLPTGHLVRMSKGRPAKGAVVVLKTEADAVAHNASLAPTVAA